MKNSKQNSHQVTTAEVIRIARKISERSIETKHFYTNSGTSALTFVAAGTLLPLSQVGTGTSDSTRVGDEIRAKHLRVAMRLVAQASSTPTAFRVIVFRWKPLASASIPASSSVLYESMAQDYQSALSALDPKNVPSQAIILRDELILSTSPYVNTPSGGVWDVPLDFPMIFTGETYSTNAIYLLLVGMGATATSSYVYNSQFTYSDG